MTPPSSTGLSMVPGNPTFRDSAVNMVALVPLLSSNKDGDISTTRSAHSFGELWTALARHANIDTDANAGSTSELKHQELLMVVPNSSLTCPGDWRYNDTPLKAFHWQHGCQRFAIFDGRPTQSRSAHDRLYNHALTRDWIDAVPSFRVAAVVGVLNMHDCGDLADLHRAEEELTSWASRYATPPYAVTAHAQTWERDTPFTRLFVFDSFDEACQKIDLNASNLGNRVLAFPPTDETHAAMIELHLNVVVNDLAVAIFCALEARIQESEEIVKHSEPAASTTTSGSAANQPKTRRTLSRIMSAGSSSSDKETEDLPSASTKLSLSNMVTLVNPASKLATDSHQSKERNFKKGKVAKDKDDKSVEPKNTNAKPPAFPPKTPMNGNSASSSTAKGPQLLTPMDEVWDLSELSPKDAHAVRKRELGRRQKYTADLALLAGSPLDAYERYLAAAEALKVGTPDPLWYALTLEGCAASHIAMADAGGYGVDEYLENNFQMPDEIMALVKKETQPEKRITANKQTLPDVVMALCDEALNITNRHTHTGSFYTSLLLRMANYVSEHAEAHLRCRWGEGVGSFSGNANDSPRCEKPSVRRLQFHELKTAEGNDIIAINEMNRIKKFCELLHAAVSAGALDTETRVDVAAKAASSCLDGVPASCWVQSTTNRIRLPRKAAFFATVAADALSVESGRGNAAAAEALWLSATHLYTATPNHADGTGSYGWASLRASTLHALSLLSNSTASQQAAEQLLELLWEISPDLSGKPDGKTMSKKVLNINMDIEKESLPSEENEGSKDTHNRSGVDTDTVAATTSAFAKKIQESFTSMTADSSLLAVQAKWADEGPIEAINFPFSPSLKCSSAKLALGSVWSQATKDECADAQLACIDRIAALHRALPTRSGAKNTPIAEGTQNDVLPLYIASEISVRSEPILELECVKLSTTLPAEDQGAMATFYNPFSRKENNVQVTRVAGGEERAFSIQFGNRLVIPLIIQRCDLVFGDNANDRIQATPLSFVVPPKATNFVVQFPFMFLSEISSDRVEDVPNLFEVKGLNLNFMGRMFFVSMYSAGTAPTTKDFKPLCATEAAGKYPLMTVEKKEDKKVVEKPRLEAFHYQPRLQIFFHLTGVPLQSEALFAISLSPCEVYSLPELRLVNYAGSTGHGKIEQLQIVVMGLLGIGERVVFDSSARAGGEAVQSTETFATGLNDGKDAPAVCVRAVTQSLRVDGINNRDNESNTLTLQIAGSHNLNVKLLKNSCFIIRFRFRGKATRTTEVWRKVDIRIQLTSIQGPSISSITFQPNLLKSCGFDQLCYSLQARSPLKCSERNSEMSGGGTFSEIENLDAPNCIGTSTGIHVCTKDLIFVATVANPFGCDIVLSRPGGFVGGFAGHLLSTVLVKAGLSTSFPVCIRRIAPKNEDGSEVNILDEFSSQTRLLWTLKDTQNPISSIGKGFVQLNTETLREQIRINPAFLCKICYSPCEMQLYMGGIPVDEKSTEISSPLGSPVDLAVEVKLASWVSIDVLKFTDLSVEFFCARQDGTFSSKNDHVWCGKLRQRLNWEEEDVNSARSHRVRVVFVDSGRFLLSVCIRISRGKDSEEVWWAPVAARVYADNAKLLAR